MKKIKIERYFTPNSFQEAIRKSYLKKDNQGLIFDLSSIPEDYEVVIRSIKNRKRQQIIYQNFKERE